MSIQPVCDFCHKELEDFGGLVFSPPTQGALDTNQSVEKFHMCKACFSSMKNVLDKNAKATESKAEYAIQNIKPGIYKHSKSGNLYRVIGLSKHTESFEDLVIYESMYDNQTPKLLARPASMFLEEVLVGESYVPRFQFVSENI
jgi:hypothetical protein